MRRMFPLTDSASFLHFLCANLLCSPNIYFVHKSVISVSQAPGANLPDYVITSYASASVVFHFINKQLYIFELHINIFYHK
jgi:hypothetical protein